jgi:hypothetical protein
MEAVLLQQTMADLDATQSTLHQVGSAARQLTAKMQAQTSELQTMVSESGALNEAELEQIRAVMGRW